MINLDNFLKELNTYSDCRLAIIFDSCSNKTDTELTIRKSIMDILEKRNIEKFNLWLDDEVSNKMTKYFDL